VDKKMNAPDPNSKTKTAKPLSWQVNLGIGLATGIILGMLIASWGLRQENWQKAGRETVAVVMLVIVCVITAIVASGTAFVRNGFRCSRWAIVIAISIFAVVIGSIFIFLETTRVQRASVAKLTAAGAKFDYEQRPESGLEILLGEQNIKYFKNVVSVEWDCGKIPNPDLSFLNGLDAIEKLWLNGIKCPPTNFTPLKSYPRLRALTLKSINISDDASLSLENNPELRELFLQSINISDHARLSLINNPKLREIDLQSINLSDDAFLYLENNPSLKELYFMDCHINDKSWESIGMMHSLTNLGLRNTPINNSGFQQISKLAQLKEIDLSFYDSDDEIAHLKSFVNLEILFLDQVKITDQGLKYLVALTNLKKIILLDTQVTDEGVETLKESLPNCTIIKRNNP
jgi:hypothetical protein